MIFKYCGCFESFGGSYKSNVFIAVFPVNIMLSNKEKIKILFICTGNSCRSQIAEGWARHLKGDLMEVYSAGLSPGALNQMAVRVMAEAGVDISTQISEHISEFTDKRFDYVVTVCDNAAEHCPVFSGGAKHIHKAFEDPSFMSGTEKQVLTAFRKLRDRIRQFVQSMPQSLEKPDNN